MFAMMTLGRLFDRLAFASGSSRAAGSRSPAVMESVEERMLMAAGPQVKEIWADNRGQVSVTFDRPVMRNSISNQSVQVFAIGKNGQKVAKPATVSFNRKTNTLTATSRIRLYGAYEVRLVSGNIRGLDGSGLDGEFNGARRESGNGEAGGDYVVRTQRMKSVQARYTTSLGVMNVQLLPEDTPKTVENFLYYANRRDWDGTFFHRSARNQGGTPFVIQGGGYRVENNKVTEIADRGPVQNEPTITPPRNVRGTLAMARRDDNNPATTDDVNSATNEWFFNAGDNRALDTVNQGFTVFGRVMDRASLRVMDNIHRSERIINASSQNSVLGEVPVINPQRVVQRQGVFANDLIYVRRLAIRMNVVAPPNGSGQTEAAANAPQTETAVPATVFATAPLTLKADVADGRAEDVWGAEPEGVL